VLFRVRIPEELDDILEEDSNTPQVIDIKKQLDDLFGEEPDDKEIS
jgi:hypothetical protein